MLEAIRRAISLLRQKQILHKVGVAISVTVIGIACYVLYHMLRGIDTYEVIEAMEIFALERAELTAQDLANMAATNDAMRASIERKKAASALTADEAFHGIWMSRAQNSELWVLVAQLKAKMRRVELAYWDRAAQTEQSVREHLAILRALRKGSRREAIAALKQNWEGSMRRLRTVSKAQNSGTKESIEKR